MKFTGTKNYVSTEDLSMAVNATIALERPLIIKGEPGTGKTLLAVEVAQSLGMDLIEWHIKSTTKASNSYSLGTAHALVMEWVKPRFAKTCCLLKKIY